PARQSPAANRPGTFVCSVPSVSTKPRSSKSTSPLTISVFGLSPLEHKTPAGRSSTASPPPRRARTTDSRWPSPLNAAGGNSVSHSICGLLRSLLLYVLHL